MNATFQYVSRDVHQPFNLDYIDMGVAGFTSLATTGSGLLPTMYINTLGAYSGSMLKMENPLPSMAAAGLGTSAGYPIGKGVQMLPTNKYLTPASKNFFSTTLSSGAQEKIDGEIEIYLTNKIK